MLRSFLIITFRILWRNKVTSFVNIFGLSIGMAVFVFIMLYVHHEARYDKFNKNYDRIYRLEGDGFGKLPPMVGAFVKERLPEVVNIARLAAGWKVYISYTPDNNPEAIKQIEVNHFYADSTTFNVFTFPFLHGDPHTALKQPMAVVLTETTAKKLFGEIDPMRKSIQFDGYEYMVTGIIRDVKYSHIEIDVLFSLESIAKVLPDRDLNKTARNSWIWSATYLLMTEKVDEREVEDKINKALSEINDGSLIDNVFQRFHIRALKELYLDGDVQFLSYGLHGNLKMTRVLVAIGIFMLVLAGFNYINLTTARSAIRAKEVAVKRVTGSSANQLRFQLIVESIIVSFISLGVAMTIVQLFLSTFNQLTMVNIQINELNHPRVWLGIAGGGVVMGILAGIYPAFYLTATQPVRLMKGKGISDSGGSMLRSGLMTFQFTVSIVMIVAIIVNFRQMRYLRNADLGFNKDQVITVITPDDISDDNSARKIFKERLLRHPGIEMVTCSYGNPGMDIHNSSTMEIDGVKRSTRAMYIDQDYINVLGIEVSKGTGFSQQSPVGNAKESGTLGKVGDLLINESMVRDFGFTDPIGKVIYTHDKDSVGSKIIGVVKDFHYRSFHDKIEPLIMMWIPDGNTTSIKVTSSDIPATVKEIQSEWKIIWGNKPFSYQFLDETFDKQYKSDEQLTDAVGYFTGLAVIIACLGLFALSSFMVTRRTKEIGVRKTLGASVGRIYFMLSWDFMKWIFLAIVIACPLAWYMTQLWLETFAYHVTLSAEVFMIAALLSIAIALTTVTWQSIRAARANPVKSLRYE